MTMPEPTDGSKDSGNNTITPATTPTHKKKRGKLSLVPPIQLTSSFPGKYDTPILTPSSDLSLLLSDTKLRARYKEGRYKPGTNVGRKIRYFPSHLSHISSLIGKDCTPKCSMAVVIVCSLHIGILDMLEWPSTSSLAETYDRFLSSVPTLKERTVYQVEHTFQEQPKDLTSHPRVVVLPELVDDDLKRLAAATGVSTTALASFACILTLTSQPNKYLHKEITAQLVDQLEEFRLWLGWKSRLVGRAIEYFENDSEEEEEERV